MGAANHTEIVDDLIGAAVIQVRGRPAVAHAKETFDTDYRKSLLVFAQRPAIGTAHFEPVNTQRFDGEIGVRARAQLLDVSLDPAESDFVQESRIERVYVLNAEIRIRESRIVEKVRIQIHAGKVFGRVDEMHGNLVLGAEDLVDP